MPDLDVWSLIEIRTGDITRLAVDAVVNAANERLVAGGGVDGAIRRAAGMRELEEACRRLGGCPTGDAKITPGFNLPARFIIHTVGPVYSDGRHGEPELLASCYRRSLKLAADKRLKSIAFPGISTGIYGFPFEAATEIAFRTTADFLADDDVIERVIFVFFSRADFETARRIHARLAGHG